MPIFDGFPPLPDKRLIHPEEVSPFTRYLMEKNQVRAGTVPKLICDLTPKRNYIIHGRNLVYLLSLGVRLIRVHRGISFRQAAWLYEFVMGNNGRRKKSRSQFERDFWKLINNST